MGFRVYERNSNNDVTDEKDWYIDTDGDLRYLTDDVGYPLAMASGDYYYVLEIEVL